MLHVVQGLALLEPVTEPIFWAVRQRFSPFGFQVCGLLAAMPDLLLGTADVQQLSYHCCLHAFCL
jgi:hypothetical protein